MKNSIQHITKKYYTTPKIEEVEIDVAISLNPDASGGEHTNPDLSSSPITKESSPQYRSEYPIADSPFGDTSEPRY